MRIGVGRRLGLNICEPHRCPCGMQVDNRGLHCLSCKVCPGRLIRHNLLTDILCRAFISAGIPPVPVGLELQSLFNSYIMKLLKVKLINNEFTNFHKLFLINSKMSWKENADFIIYKKPHGVMVGAFSFQDPP